MEELQALLQKIRVEPYWNVKVVKVGTVATGNAG